MRGKEKAALESRWRLALEEQAMRHAAFERRGKKDPGEVFRGAAEGKAKHRPKSDEAPVIFNLNKRAVSSRGPQQQQHSYQGVPLHVLPAGELLPADLTGIGSFSRVGSHVSLQDALMHG